MTNQTSMNLPDDRLLNSVEEYKFEPIKGYPMLNWKGKRPFTSTRYYPAQLKEVHGYEVNGWRNKIYWGDNLQVMSHLLREYRGEIDLIYIDPPFDSRIEYRKKISLKGKILSNDPNSFEEKQYADIWINDEYLQFMYERFLLLRELLSDNGSLYMHCDYHKSHHLRCILDEIFGESNFINEITWHYYNKMAPDSKCFPRASDKIISYAKKLGNHIFHKQEETRDKPVKQLVRKFVDGKAINARDEDGNVQYRMTDTKRIDDVWRISMLQPADKTENINYPTQKPEAVIERIISASSEPNSIVLDCFMGSGTTQAVAMKLGRRFIGADINLGAVQATTKRLLGIAEKLTQDNRQQKLLGEQDGAKPTTYYVGFEVYNVNYYEVFRSPIEARDLLLDALEVNHLPAGHLFDGEKEGRMVKLMPVNRIATRADLSTLIAGFDYKAFERRKSEKPNQPVEKITLVCMGHEPDLKAVLQEQVKPYLLDVEVLDILRDKQDLQFKRDSEAKITVQGDFLVIERFYPMNLLGKLSLQKEKVEDWRELVESVMVDWNYDGAVLNPATVDVPDKNTLVSGKYRIPEDAGTIRIKITDLLSESLEMTVSYG